MKIFFGILCLVVSISAGILKVREVPSYMKISQEFIDNESFEIAASMNEPLNDFFIDLLDYIEATQPNTLYLFEKMNGIVNHLKNDDASEGNMNSILKKIETCVKYSIFVNFKLNSARTWISLRKSSHLSVKTINTINVIDDDLKYAVIYINDYIFRLKKLVNPLEDMKSSKQEDLDINLEYKMLRIIGDRNFYQKVSSGNSLINSYLSHASQQIKYIIGHELDEHRVNKYMIKENDIQEEINGKENQAPPSSSDSTEVKVEKKKKMSFNPDLQVKEFKIEDDDIQDISKEGITTTQEE